MNDTTETLKYPIGKFKSPKIIGSNDIAEAILILEEFPRRLIHLVEDLTSEQLESSYRPGGWTIRQLIHHIADSHHHSYTRFKWALAEDGPLIKAYQEKEWSNLFDANTAPIILSLNYISALHAKLVYLLRGLSPKDLKKFFIHPEDNLSVTVEENILKYAWHSQHHYAHIEAYLKRES